MITPTPLEGHAVKIADVADHTFVKCPANNQYFNCWGGHSGDEDRIICSSPGLYEVADRYRRPLGTWPDTAGIGMYAVNGVCHQTANLFLYSSQSMLDLRVRGYWFSVFLYSVYGTPFPLGGLFAPVFLSGWLLAVYIPALQEVQRTGIAPAPAQLRQNELGEGATLFEKIQRCHAGLALNARMSPNNHDITVAENATILRHVAPAFDAGSLESFHRAVLTERDGILRSDLKGEARANRINELAKNAQRGLAERVGPELFRQMTGMTAGETINIVNPEMAARLGT